MNAKKTYFNLGWALGVILTILLLDQGFKIYIKLNYPLSGYGVPPIVDWGFFKLLFVENKGMAMGAKLNDFLPFISEDTAKLVLTLFRIVAIFGLGYWLWDAVKKQTSTLLNWALALIFAGALGNIIDSVFYGVLFSDSYGKVAQIFPAEGYAPLFYGNVVDMLQFPLVEWTWPSWMPWVGGEEYLFFQYIFNLADTAISTGVGILIVFNKRIFSKTSAAETQ
ncbi:MAG: lipoprotein signal peptidase [Flavobacteriaceae bacterium]|nr:lipoprotein signal peptidase [Flavobacteriaceae bacterium]MDG1920847.1 lipoprotein signal peptidase [Flavobacteriaceae bacterium]